MLIGLTKRCGVRLAPSSMGSHGQITPGVKAGPSLFAAKVRNVVSPYFSQPDHRKGKRPVREADGSAGKRNRRKRKPLVAERIGIEHKQHNPAGNRADFWLVSIHEIVRRTFNEKESK